MAGGPSRVFTRKALEDETFIRKPTNLCKSIVGTDPSQWLSHLNESTKVYWFGWEYENEIKRFTLRQNKSCSFENMVFSFFQRFRPDCKNESSGTTDREKKVIVSVWTEVAIIVKLLLNLWEVIITFVLIRKFKLIWVMQLLREEWRKGNKTRCVEITYKKYSMLLRCGSVSVGVSIKLMHQSKIIYEKTLSANALWAKNKSCKEILLGNSLDGFNVILKFPNNCDVLSQTFLHFPKNRTQ